MFGTIACSVYLVVHLRCYWCVFDSAGRSAIAIIVYIQIVRIRYMTSSYTRVRSLSVAFSLPPLCVGLLSDMVVCLSVCLPVHRMYGMALVACWTEPQAMPSALHLFAGLSPRSVVILPGYHNSPPPLQLVQDRVNDVRSITYGDGWLHMLWLTASHRI